MKTLEFETIVQHGVIRLPDDSIPDQPVRVKVWLEEQADANPPVQAPDEHEHPKRKGNFDPAALDAAFAEVVKLNPFRDIDNPVEWQRRQRDEWE